MRFRGLALPPAAAAFPTGSHQHPTPCLKIPENKKTAGFLVPSQSFLSTVTGKLPWACSSQPLRWRPLDTQAAGSLAAVPADTAGPGCHPAGPGVGRQSPKAHWCPLQTRRRRGKNSSAPWVHLLVSQEYLRLTSKKQVHDPSFGRPAHTNYK